MIKMKLPQHAQQLLNNAPSIIWPETRAQLLELALGGPNIVSFDVAYNVTGKGEVVEANVVKCNNGIVVNYTDAYLRRRDPDCMLIGDLEPSDKEYYAQRYDSDFAPLKADTFAWLEEQDLIVMPFSAGGVSLGYPALLIAPANAGFFAGGLADLQGFIPASQVPEDFTPKAIIYLAPTFRHTHFDGKQMVVHDRSSSCHELFSYNLYPGPSAKKGVYGILLHIGESEGWITLHGSTVKVITPYENVLTIMHEGASGGGKSEMTEQLHREYDGRVLIGKNKVTGEKFLVELKETCELKPVTDDMALCHPKLQNDSKKLVVTDAEKGWFLRTDNITHYGTDPYLENLCIHPVEPLIFINYEAAPNSTCLIWEHKMDAPGKPCPNPRVIMPRHFVPDIVNEPVEIDIRSFGFRAPMCTKDHPTYGIVGMLHILPPALAWIWRLVAPRGHDNPSVTTTEGMSSEGVGSYWPFATGKKVQHANLLLEQILASSNTRYILIPNQNIGAYKVGFMPQWIAREYLARRGSAKFNSDQLLQSRCPILGYALRHMKIDGTYMPKDLLEVQLQPEVGVDGYDQGALILTDFFKKELSQYLDENLHPLGRQIIECCIKDAPVEAYIDLVPMKQ